MFDKNVIVIFVLTLIILYVWNYDMPVVEGAKFNVSRNIGPAAASVAVPAAIATAAQTQLPVDFKEIQIYLDKLKTYSEDAQKMADSVKSTTEEYSKAYEAASSNLTKLSEEATINVDKSEETAKKVDAINKDIMSKATDIQAQVNSNNIIKNEIVAKINEMKDIDKNILDKSIEVKNSTEMANEYKNTAADYLQSLEPTGARIKVIQTLVEGFSGFSQSVLEGYTFFSEPDSNGKNAFDLEQALIQAINDFNTAYYAYLSNKTQGNKESLNIKTGNLNTKITTLKDYITRPSSHIGEDEFNTNHNNIKNKSTEIENLRNDLDIKMKEILNHKSNQVTDTTIARDTAAYTTILWTALATSALYFIFVKIE